MANYNLIIPTITELCRKIGVPNAMVGIIIGCCDIATIPGTIGGLLPSPHIHQNAPFSGFKSLCWPGLPGGLPGAY